VELDRFRGGFRDQGVELGRYMYGGRSWIWIRLLPVDFMFCSEDHLIFCPSPEFRLRVFGLQRQSTSKRTFVVLSTAIFQIGP